MENHRYYEIFKLNDMLSAAEIPHDLIEVNSWLADEGYQIRMYADAAHKNLIDDCICHSFSHGFSEGLLETYSLSNCAGYETADEVFKGWVKMYVNAVRGEN